MSARAACCAIGLFAAFGGRVASAAVPSLAVDAGGLAPAVARYFEAHCYSCHTAEASSERLDLKTLSTDVADPLVAARWQQVLQRVVGNEMPPPEEPRPPVAETQAVAKVIRRAAAEAVAKQRAEQGRVAARRLNRIEYENTLRDLLGVDVSVRESLPADSVTDGFDNQSSALHTSSFLLDRYLDAADVGLDAAIANRPQPPLFKKRIRFQDERTVKIATQSVYRDLGEGKPLVMFSSSPWNAVTVGQFYPKDRGRYRIRISCSAYQSGDQPVSMHVEAGPMQMGQKNHLVGYYSIPPGKPTVVEFEDYFEPRYGIRVGPFGTIGANQIVQIGGAEKYDGPGLAIEWVDVEGPLHDVWPPESHRRIFGDLKQTPSPRFNERDRVEVTSADPKVDAEKIMRRFADRAFRRPATDADVSAVTKLVESKLAEGYSFEQAVRVGLKRVLISPKFLFLDEQPGRLDDAAVAARLSYFLWSTQPDEPLHAAAVRGLAGDRELLRSEVERLLGSPKAAEFTKNFCGQWLKLREIDSTAPDRRLYPEFDDLLKDSMLRETHLFFEDVLKNDRPLTNFVASDFTYLNDRLARHYGIPDVAGQEVRRVSLPAGSERGGVLTMGAVLKVTANGTSTSPVVRGAFVLDRILGMPPPPPPDGVPAVEPDIRGATTIRAQLAKHRELTECAGCHKRIDPPGFALEQFDVIGGKRTYYRSLGGGRPVPVPAGSPRVSYAQGRDVDAVDALADGRRFADCAEYKRLLLADKDALARGLARQLVTYATGRAPDLADAEAIEKIVDRVREKRYGFRTLVHEVVQSDLFLRK